jgi:putative redox protein
MKFECTTRGMKSMIDASPEHGGEDTAPTPKELVMNAMMGCTAMDVVAMLTKMRQKIDSFDMHIEVEKNKDYPVHFIKAHLVFDLKGQIDIDKAKKSVDSSLSKYCGVNYMISKTCEITYSLKLNDQVIHEGQAIFIDPKN